MGYDLYVVILNDGSWRFVPYTYNKYNKVSTYYMKGSDRETLDLAREHMDTDDPRIKSWELVTKVLDSDEMTVQDAMNDAYKMDMNRLRDRPNVLRPEEAEGVLGNIERHGTWSQTFVILSLKRLEDQEFLAEGTVEEFKKKLWKRTSSVI